MYPTINNNNNNTCMVTYKGWLILSIFQVENKEM